MKKLFICLLTLLCAAFSAHAEEARVIDGVIFSADGRTLIEYPENKTDAYYTVPYGVEVIGEGAFFQNEHITHIKLPDSVKVIGVAAFQYCENLTQIDMPERMSELGRGAFVGTRLTTLRIPIGVKDIPAELLMSMPCLTDVYLPWTLDTIAGKGLDEAWDFGKISDDPCVMLHAEYNAAAEFARLSEQPYIIESAYLPTDTLSVTEACMENWGEEWALCTDEYGRPLFTYSEDTAVAFVTDGPRTNLCFFSRKDGSWYEDWSMPTPLFGVDDGLTPTSIRLVDNRLSCFLRWGDKAVSVEAEFDYHGWGNWYVTEHAFYTPAEDGGWHMDRRYVHTNAPPYTPPLLDFFFLTAQEQEPVVIEGNTLVRYPESRTDAHYVVPDGVEIIGENAFESNYALTRVTLPESVRVIRDQAFSYCHNLRVVDMPSTLESLGESTFDCTYVQQLTIPDGLTELPNWAFCAADLQGTVIIPEGVTNIGDECFAFNAGITDMYLPASLQTMGGESVDEGWGFDFIYAFNHIDPGQEHMTVHAPAGTEAAKFAERSGYPYVIEDARSSTDLPAMTALVQAALDEALPGATVCENEYGFSCVSYSSETVFAFATRETGGWYDEWYLCCFDRRGEELTLLWTNDALYGEEWPQFWPEIVIPLDMKLIGDHFTLTLQVGEETAIDLTFSGEGWNLTYAAISVWYEPGDGGPNHWDPQLTLPITDGAPLREFSTIHYTVEE